MRRKKYKTLSPPVDYWFLVSLFLAVILLMFTFLLIQERQFLVKMGVYLNKYKVKINGLSNFNAQISNSHLSLPTNPSSSSKIIYIGPESFTLR
jgi:hypothetical protein